MLSYKHEFIKKIKKATLQVRTYIIKSLSKRVYKKASLTVEAAFALSIFIFSLVIIMLPFKMLDANRKMLSLAENINKKICQYAYISNYLDKKEGLNKKEEGKFAEGIDISQISESSAFATLINPYVVRDAKRLINDKHISDISSLDSEFLVKDDIVSLRIKYKYKLPFAILGLGSINQEVTSSRRLWVGRDGRSKEGDNGVLTASSSKIFNTKRQEENIAFLPAFFTFITYSIMSHHHSYNILPPTPLIKYATEPIYMFRYLTLHPPIMQR